MPIKLSTPIVKTFILEDTDKNYGTGEDVPTTVVVKQATQAQHEFRQQLFATLERKYSDSNPDETSLVQTANIEVLKRLECFLTVVDCNILKEDGKKPLFLSKKGRDGLPEIDMNEKAFNDAWGLLPPDVATEIHKKVLEVNVMWGPRGG